MLLGYICLQLEDRSVVIAGMTVYPLPKAAPRLERNKGQPHEEEIFVAC